MNWLIFLAGAGSVILIIVMIFLLFVWAMMKGGM